MITDISCEFSRRIRIIVTVDGPCLHPFLVPNFLIIFLQSAADGTTDPSVRVTPCVRIFIGHHFCRFVTIELQILLHALGIEHITQLTATIDLPDIGTFLQIHLGIFRPGIFTSASTIDSAGIAIFLQYRCRNIDLGVEGATHIVVTTIDSTIHTGISTKVVHVCLIHITRRENVHAVCTTEDIVDLDGRLLRHVDKGTAGNTLLIAATVCGTHPSAHQVDDGAGFVDINSSVERICRRITHAKAIVGTGTENLRISEIIYALRNVNQHIAVVL